MTFKAIKTQNNFFRNNVTNIGVKIRFILGLSSPSVSLDLSKIDPSYQYRISAISKGPEGNGLGKFTFQVNLPPMGGSCSIIPDEGK